MFKKYEKKGLTGLANLGNTCFINSTIQCISHIYELNDFLNITMDNDKINEEKRKKLYQMRFTME